MSYKRKNYVLRWPEGHVRHGLEVTMRGLSFENLDVVSGMAGISRETMDMDQIRGVLSLLSARMVRWNFTDELDEPVLTTPEALAGEDFGMIMEIVTAWTHATMGVKASLGKDSNSGGTFQEALIPMESL